MGFNEARDAFHGHLDACRQCREQCFNPCPVGARLLQEAATAGGQEITRTAVGPLASILGDGRGGRVRVEVGQPEVIGYTGGGRQLEGEDEEETEHRSTK